MNRREFLVSTAAVSTGVLPLVANADLRPCLPATVGVKGGIAISNSCTGVAGSAPNWFVNLPFRTWTELAGGAGASSDWQRGARLTDVAPVPTPGSVIGDAYDKDVGAIVNNWTGFVVDQDRGHLISAAAGGHWGYMGNEVYRLDLHSQTPGWARVLDPTPDVYEGKPLLSSRGFGSNPFKQDIDSPEAMTHYDWSGPTGRASPKPYGRLRPLHNYNTFQFANGRVWVCPPTGANGQCFALDYDGIANGTVPKEWSLSANPWTHIGKIGGRVVNAGAANFTGTPTVLDTKRNRLWGFLRYYGVAWSVDVSPGVLAQSRIAYFKDGAFSLGGLYDNSECWAVYCEDLDIIVMSIWTVDNVGTARLAVFNAASMPSDSWTVAPGNVPLFGSATTDDPGSPAPRNRKGYGAVYDKRTRSILVYDPQGIVEGKIATLKVPDNPRTGLWQWSLRPAAASSVAVQTAAAWQGAFSKFNVIRDMGNGQACLVAATREDGPTYVYKLES